MARKGEQFAGLTVALITPFKNGKVDELQLRKIVDEHVAAGTNCICPCGTTGESPTLSHEEHERVVSIVCEQAAGRITVIAGTGSNSTAEATRLTRAAQAAGAQGALMVGPYYNKPTQEGFYRHFATVAEACDLPIMLYNIPGRTAKNIEPDTICKLGEIPSIVAVKEATGLMDQASQILSGSNLTVLSGDDSLTLPILALGGSGHCIGRWKSDSKRYSRADCRLEIGQCRGGAALSSSVVPALPGYALFVDQPHSAQSRAAPAGAGYGRSSTAADAAYRERNRQAARNDQALRPAVTPR